MTGRGSFEHTAEVPSPRPGGALKQLPVLISALVTESWLLGTESPASLIHL